jgi:hypothetical protein
MPATAVGQRPSLTGQWWVTTVHGQLAAVQSTTKPVNFTAGPFTSQKAAEAWIQSNTGSGLLPIPSFLKPSTWLASLGGDLASGIEAGFVTTLRDIWAVIVGPLEIVAGLVIIFMVLTIYFKNDIMALAPMIGMALA